MSEIGKRIRKVRECREYADRNGIRVIDRALSASKDTDKRLDFQRMIRDSGKHLFDTVLVWKLDRFARNRYGSAHYKNILKKNGVRVVSAAEHITEGPEGIILEYRHILLTLFQTTRLNIYDTWHVSTNRMGPISRSKTSIRN